MKKLFYFFAILMALYSLPSLAQGDPSPAVNMDKYITLTVQSGKDIKLNFKAPQANTPVRIVSGSNTQDITVGTNWYFHDELENDNFSVKSDGTTMTIYGDITGFICSENGENLTSLDVSKNTQLATLYCYRNQLTSLDVSKNTQLTELYCRSNQLTSLDVSKNTQLATLYCGGNDLTSLDVRNNTQLTWLFCGSNQLTSLDVSKNTQLTGLFCGSNQLTSLDVSNNTQLTWLSCGSNQLTSLDVSNNTQLNTLYCYGNQLTSLDVSKNTQLDYLECYRNKFTTESMNELYCSMPDRQGQYRGKIYPLYKKDDANHAEIVAATSDNARAKNWKVNYFFSQEYVPSNGNYDCSNPNPTPNMSKYITLTVQSGKDIKLNFKAAQANTPVRIVSGTNTQDITVGTDWYVQNKLENDNFSVKSDGTTMTIYGDITVFACSYNLQNLTSLDVSKNPQLTNLNCFSNKLTSLDVSKNPQLTELYCFSNKLTSLDVSKNPQLTTLNCSLNELTSLDVSKNPQLTELDCTNNQLTSLDVSKNPQLTTLSCYSNNLTSLDVSKNPQLTELDCSDNKLTSLDVSKNPQLTTLECYNNQLTSLDVSKNTQLTELLCYVNKFTTESMNELYCSLPDRQGQNQGLISPVYKQDDANHAEIVAATSDNARAKNWEVKYDYWNIEELDVPSNGNYDCNSGVDEHLSSGISVFPNPASGKVQIKLSESVNETLILVDLAGRAVLLEDVVAGRANIDVSNLTAGTYFIRIGNITKKLTVK